MTEENPFELPDDLPPDPFGDREVEGIIIDESMPDPDHPDYRALLEIVEGIEKRINVNVEEVAEQLVAGDFRGDQLEDELRNVIDVDSVLTMSAKRGALTIERLTALAKVLMEQNGLMLMPPVFYMQIAGSSFIDGFLAGYYFSQTGGHRVV